MKFGTTLRKSIYQPWKDKYVDYDKLKKLLKDNEDDDTWTSDDEEAFVNELANVQLEKVHDFIVDISQKLRDRTSACEKKLEPLAIGVQSGDNNDGKEGDSKDSKGEGLSAQAGHASKKPELSEATRQKLLKEVLRELDSVTKETKELESFSRLNFTAIIKATKKHDKLRGVSYKLRPFIDARIVARPLHSEDASPLLYRLSALYSFVRQSLEGKSKDSMSFGEDSTSGEGFTSHKCTCRLWQLRHDTNAAQSGCIWTTSSKSRLSFSAVSPSSYTTRKPPKSPRAANATPRLPRSTSTTPTSRSTRTRLIASPMQPRSV
jgi:SPX domain protein involved in polyphosphate accumulation